jgi:hypothetical protein
MGVFYGQRIFCADVYNAVGSTDGVGSDEHALEDGVRNALEKAAVHEGAWVALVGVADNVLFITRSGAAELPFEACGKTCTAAPAKARELDFFDDRVGSHLEEGLCQSSIPVIGYVVIQVSGVYSSVEGKDDASLGTIEGDFVLKSDPGTCRRVYVKELLHGLPIEHCALDNERNGLGLNHGVENSFWEYYNDGALLAKTWAASAFEAYAIAQATGLDFALEGCINVLTATSNAACAGANGYRAEEAVIAATSLFSTLLKIVKRSDCGHHQCTWLICLNKPIAFLGVILP